MGSLWEGGPTVWGGEIPKKSPCSFLGIHPTKKVSPKDGTVFPCDYQVSTSSNPVGSIIQSHIYPYLKNSFIAYMSG